MQQSEYICLNGKFNLSTDPVFKLNNRAFRYGDALFETIYASGGVIPFFRDHYDRLTRSMKILKMQCPPEFTRDILHKEITGLLTRNKLFQGARIRLTVFRDGGGLYSPDSNNIAYLIEATRIDNDRFILNDKGFIIDVYDHIKKPVNILSNLKTTNSLLYVLAGIYKKENGIDDCIILNENNIICEAISSNIFIAKDNVILTPSLESGCVSGIMRERIINIAADMNYTVYDDSHFNTNELLTADELFLTNAVAGIRWVLGFKKRRYYNRIAKIITKRLNEVTFS